MTPTRRRPGALRALATAAALLVPAVATAPPAHAATTCSFDAATAKLSVDNRDVGGLAKLSRTAAGAIQVNGVACGSATVSNTDLIEVTGAVGLQSVVVDLAGGAFAPGKTAEADGASEIEIKVDAGYGGEFPAGDQVSVSGTPGADTVRFGTEGIFLSADADADVTTTSVEVLGADGLGGDDRLLGSGNGHGGAAPTANLRLSGGDANDELVGGEGNDALDGGLGSDTESGGNGTDVFTQGVKENGSDVLDGGGSPYDRIDYSKRTSGVRIDLDGEADDGRPAELDNVKDTFEYLDGGAGSDRVIASATRYQPFRISTGAGNDTITGGSNYDELISGAGNDVIDGGGGSDTFRAGAGDDRQRGGDGGDTFYEDEDGGPTGADDVGGGAGVDHYYAPYRTAAMTIDNADNLANDGAANEGDNVRSDVESITTGAGADRIVGSAAANTLSGGAGNDDIRGGGGNDVAYGRAGKDTIQGESGNDQLYGYEDDDVIAGGSGNDDLRGGYGADRIEDGDGTDKAYGEGDGDVLVAPATADTADVLTGGDGTDEVTYAARTAAVTVTLDATGNDGASGEADNVSAEKVTGGQGADRITGSATADDLQGAGGADILDGAGGNDFVHGADGADEVRGGDGDDGLAGGLGADLLAGDAGTDVADYSARTEALTVSLDGSANDGASGEGDNAQTENVRGGQAHDRLTGDADVNRLDGDLGDDIVDGGTGADVLVGSAGADTASYAGRTGAVAVKLDGVAQDGADPNADGIGDEGDDVTSTIERVAGGSGNDRLTGSASDNALLGGGGDDRLDGGLGADVIDGEAGRDTADYSQRTADLTIALDNLPGDGESGEGDRVTLDTEVVQGGSGNDRITGGAGNQELHGNNGSDVLSGGFGNGDGDDVLFGGAGFDTASYKGRLASDPVKVTIDDLPNDGRKDGSERDNVRGDVENLVGGFGDDELVGNRHSNVLNGGPGGQDTLFGEDGDDTLDESVDPVDPMVDQDQLHGGAGRDLADYSKRTASLTITLDDFANDGVPATGTAAGEGDNVHTDVEDVTTGSGHDQITGSDDKNRLTSGAGTDRVEAKGEDDTLTGGNDVDRLYGGTGDDKIAGGPGNNVLYGEDGADTFLEEATWVGNDGFNGGGGYDIVDYTPRTNPVTLDNDFDTADSGEDVDRNGDAEEMDTIYSDVEVMKGGNGDDRLTQFQTKTDHSSSCEKVLYGGGGNDILTGQGTRDILYGDEGHDLLFAGGGNDYLIGGQGNDTENAGEGDDYFIQGSMNQSCNGMGWTRVPQGDGADVLNGDGGVDKADYRRTTNVTVSLDGIANDGGAGDGDNARVEDVSTGSGHDTVTGNNGANVILSGHGNDKIDGRDGDDTLWDATGTDELTGGDGDDDLRSDDGDNADVLRGGSGTETGRWDEADTLIDVP